MVKFILREVHDVKEDTILAIVSEPIHLLGDWPQTWHGINFFKVEVEIDGNSADVAVIELRGHRKYAIYGTHPRPNGAFDGINDPTIVAGVDDTITTVCNYLQKFYNEGRFNSYTDLIGLRVVPAY